MKHRADRRRRGAASLSVAVGTGVLLLFLGFGVPPAFQLCARSGYGDLLAGLGHHPEALEVFLSCYDQGRGVSGYGPTRNSFLLGSIKRLAKVYPPARAALEARLEDAEERPLAQSYTARSQDSRDLAALRRALGR